MKETHRFLPTSIKEIRDRGWEYIDVILFTGDAYVDHPSFGVAVIGRLLENQGYRVAIVPQPNWQDDLRDFRKLGAPRLFFGVSAGAMDSMVNHYTATRRLRSDDAYTPGGRAGARPDYPTLVYTRILKQLYPDIPVVIGGIEASLRRLTHYDYWQDSVRPSFLIESGADILSYGMGDRTIIEIAKAIQSNTPINSIDQIAYISNSIPVAEEDKEQIILHSYDECVESKEKFAHNFKTMEIESNRMYPRRLIEPTGDKYVVINPPSMAYFTEQEMDRSFDLPYTRLPHPRYYGKGLISAYEMIKHSVNLHRGCFGGCSFCAISAHQGKFISSRSPVSIMKEVRGITSMSDFKGNLSDIGGPSANMYRMRGRDVSKCKKCARASCIFPSLCNNLNNDHNPLLDLYQKIRNTQGIKHAFIGSGIRYDMFDNSNYLEQVIVNHTSGRLKVAPEHTSTNVLKLMRKPSYAMFDALKVDFDRICQKNGLRYQLIPYFISSHPGCSESDMVELEKITRQQGLKLEQVQDFTPTPMTLSTTMFYTGLNPYTGEKLYVAKSKEQKDRQKSHFFWYKSSSTNNGSNSSSGRKQHKGFEGADRKYKSTKANAKSDFNSPLKQESAQNLSKATKQRKSDKTFNDPKSHNNSSEQHRTNSRNGKPSNAHKAKSTTPTKAAHGRNTLGRKSAKR